MKEKKQSSLYLLPNIITAIGLAAGFYAILLSANFKYDAAIFAMTISLITDLLDGRIARLTDSQTKFGSQFDSLTDLVAFGVAPGVLLYYWSLSYFGLVIGALIAFIYTVAVAIRLARFNEQSDEEESSNSFFKGLPCPPATALLISIILYCNQNDYHAPMIAAFTVVILLALSFLMISTINYPTFKQFNLKKAKLAILGALLMLFIILIFLHSAVFGLIVFGSYAFYFPLKGLIAKNFRFWGYRH